MKSFKVFLLFGFILPYISSYVYKTNTFTILEERTEYYKTYQYSYSFKTSFNRNFNFDFLTIKVENLYRSYSGQIAFLSYSDKDCNDDRRQISFSHYGDSIMIIKKSELKNLNYFYVCVKCLDENYCYYNLRFDQNYIQRMPMTSISYNYLASKNYIQMKFGIRSEYDTIDLIEAYSNHYELYWIKRMFNNDFLKYYYYNETNNIHEDYNAVFFLKNNSRQYRLLDFDVSSKEGDIIKVGSSLIVNNYEYKLLNVNDVEAVGHLNKNNLTELCYKFKVHNYYYSSSLFNLYVHVNEKLAKAYFRNSYNNKISGTDKDIINGYFLQILTENQLTNQRLCITFLDDSDRYNLPDSITFTVQVISHKYKYNNYYFLSPQKPEDIYPRFLQKGEFIVLSAIKPPNKSNIMSFTINSIYGNIQTKSSLYSDFPYCDFTNIKYNLTETNKLKDHTDLFVSKSYYDKVQTLFFFSCTEETEFCIFDTTFFSKNDYIPLNEGESFSQLLLDNDANYFIIDVEKYKNINKIFIELILYGNNAKLNFHEENLKIVNYFLLNKKIYEIDGNDLENTNLKFEVNSNTKAYYSVRYTTLRNNDVNKMALMDTIGINFIDYIGDSYEYKNIEVKNSKYDKIFPLLINFYSPNCKFNINKNGGTKLTTSLYDNFYQENIDSNQQITYNYNISIKEFDPSNFQNKKCTLYMNSFKIITENSKKIATLLINENIPQVHQFENNLKIRYIYPNYDYIKDTLINFKLINNRKYFINITDNSNNIIVQKHIFTSETISIEKNISKTDEYNLVIDISLEDSLEEITILQTTLRQIKNKFHYLEKGMIKNEIIPKNDNLYLYTEIGKEDEGFILIDFMKEKAEIKAKIIEINNNLDLSEEVNWESINSENELSNYDYYTKKLFFKKKDTIKCQNGCYLLINIKSPMIKDAMSEINYFTFTVLVSLTKRNISNSIKIKSDFDRNIIGTLFNSNYNDKKMFELYEYYIPYNAESIDIENKLKNTTLLIYLKDKEIDFSKSDFQVEFGQAISITKDEIDYSFENTKIIICVYAEKNYFIDIPYSFSAHLNKNNNLKIYKISKEHKAICKPIKLGGNYLCLFMIEPQKLYKNNTLLINAKSDSANGKIYMYGEFIHNNTIYDVFDIDYLTKNIPTITTAQYMTGGDKINYIFVPPTDNQTYLYLSVFSNSPEIIRLITNYYNYDDIVNLNPYLNQIFLLNNGLNDEIKLNFLSKNPIMIKAFSLAGEGVISFGEKNFYLSEKNNQLLVALPSDFDESIIVKNKTAGTNEDFIFYVEYYLRNSLYNFDEIIFYENFSINYLDTDFPLFHYSTIDQELVYDINIFFNIYNLSLNEPNGTKFSSNKELDISSLFIEKNEQYKILNETERKQLEHIKGSYDGSINTGQIYISKDYANKLFYNMHNNITYLLSLEKIEDNSNDTIIYNGLSMKTYFVKENSGIPIVENQYYYGKIVDNSTKNTYKLKLDNDYVMIQFSSNSKIINFTITKDDKNEFSDDNFEGYETKEEKGKIITFLKRPNDIDYLYLHVFMNNSLNISDNLIEKLNNYAFKYNNILNKYAIREYPILKGITKLECIITENKGVRTNIQISYNKVQNQKNVEVLYALKIVNNKDYIEGELFDTIAITESKSMIKKIKNDEENDSVDVPLDIFDDNFAYIELIAQIIDGENIEYIAYEPIKSKKEIIFKYEGNKNKKYVYIFIIVPIVLLVIIAVAIFLFIRYKKRKAIPDDEELIKQVEMNAPIEYDDILLDRPSDLE